MSENIPAAVRELIDGVIEVEGDYVNDPADLGGETKYGITIATARRYGYQGDMRDLPREMAFDIYLDDYYRGPRFHWVAERSQRLAEEMTDTGVNMGPSDAVTFLQVALNALNDSATQYADIATDGYIGNRTMTALDAYLAWRGEKGERVLLAAIDSLQAAEYIRLANVREANERFVYGWLANRTIIPA